MSQKNANESESIAMADISLLENYPPRQEAIKWIQKGEIKAYLEWAKTNPSIPAWEVNQTFIEKPISRTEADSIALDDALESQLRCASKNPDRAQSEKQEEQLLSCACQRIPHFGESPIEMAVRSGDLARVDAMLDELMQPSRVFQRGYYGEIGGGWTSVDFRKALVGYKYAYRLPIVSGIRPRPVVLLAIMLGHEAIADILLRRGWAPHESSDWERLANVLRSTIQEVEKYPEMAAMAETVFQVPVERMNAAAEWLRNKANLGRYLDEQFEMEPDTAWRRKVNALLSQGAPVGYFPIAVATENQDIKLLKKLFAAGANPNAQYHTGVSLLASLDSEQLTRSLLQVWLNYGANPTHGMDTDEPYGTRMNPSAIYQWVWEGKLDLVKQATTKAVGKIQLRLEGESGDQFSALREMAKTRNHSHLFK